MVIDEELARLGEPPATPDEQAEASRLDEDLAGESTVLQGKPGPEQSATGDWLDEAVKHALRRAETCELEELGRLFPKVKPVRWLGSGGMGDVYLVRHELWGLEMALKVLRPELSGDPQFMDRFHREARAQARLNNPGIARLWDYGPSDDGRCYQLMMEYLPGGSLRERLRDDQDQPRALPPAEALRIAAEVCEALEHAHAEGIVHRDIKPENIHFDGRGRVKLTDLGLAKVSGEQTLTPSHVGAGTLVYAAPEQLENAATVDCRADLYSVGVVLYEMLTGHRPAAFSPSPATEKTGIDPAVDLLITRALQPDRERRFQEAEEMRGRIEKVRQLQKEKESREEKEAQKGTMPQSGRMKRLADQVLSFVQTACSRPNWMTAGVLVCVAIVGVLPGWLISSRHATEEEELRWGGDPSGGAPYIWEKRGTLTGFEAEIMEHLGARLHMRPKFMQVSWDMLPQALKRGDIDVIFNGYGWSPQRAREMNATLPYALVPMRLIVRKGDQLIHNWDDLRKPPPGRKWLVGTLRGSESAKYLEKQFADTVEIEAPTDGTTTMLMGLKMRRLDASVQDAYTAEHYLRTDFTELETIGDSVDATPFVAYVAHDNPPLRDRINDALKDLEFDGTLKKICQRYVTWNQEKLEDLWQAWPPHEQPHTEGLWWYAWLLVKSAGTTILLACAAWPLAMLLGLLVALGRMHGPRWLGLPLTAYVEFLRGTPLLLQLFAIYYMLPEVGIFLPAFWAAVIGLAVNYSAYESEHYRAGLLAVPRGQWEAALTLGMSKWTALRRIVVPQALRTVVPSSTNDFIGLFKDTAVCSVIAVVELTGRYQRLLVDQPRMIVTFALLAGFLYLLMSYPLALLARRLERRAEPVAA